MSKLPTLFISHGSPMLAIIDSPARRFLMELGKAFPKPKAIFVASAHWETAVNPAVSLAPQPETIYDFGGFPDELYQIRYSAPGAIDVAERAALLLEQAGIAAKRNPSRGIDHGVWVPLHLMYPSADIPVAQISIVRGASTIDHKKIGRALQKLRDSGVLIMGSGSLTHNLGELHNNAIDAKVPSWVEEFDLWMKKHLESNQREKLLDYRTQAPHSIRNHPTEEHLMPLFVAMGGADDTSQVQHLHSSFEYGVIAMDMYAFN